jgi:zinc transport system substrate-binding protein
MRLPCFSLMALIFSSSLAHADVKVMTSIKPIHSLVASVMQGVGTPGLLIDGNNSPHNYTLRPSDATALDQAEVIFWVGHQLEAFLEKPLETLGQKAKIVELMDSEGLVKLAVRENASFESHDHDDHGHDQGEEFDAHIWLDPVNATAMINTIAQTLATSDPKNADTYKSNASKATAQLAALSLDIDSNIRSLQGKSFFVFHDAYHYFENRFGLKSSGAISINPENSPGAKQISEMKQRIADGKIVCVFSEPQFDNKLVELLLEGGTAKAGVLDPLAAETPPGPELYATLLRDLASGFKTCLQ